MLRAHSILNLACALILIASALVVWQTNRQTRFCSDDYLYSHKFDPAFVSDTPGNIDYARITSPRDYAESLSRLYLTLTGRIVPHAILQIILLLPGWIFDLLNTLLLFGLTYLYSTWFAGRKQPLWLAFWLLATMLWYLSITLSKRNFYLPAFSINYLWTQVIVFLFLIPFRKLIQEGNREGGIAKALILLLFGIIAGGTNEPTVPAIMMAMGGWGFFALLRSRRDLPLWFYAGFLGLLTGFAIMFFAPGNSGRAMYESSNSGAGGIGFNLANLNSIMRDLLASLPVIILGIWGLARLKRTTFFLHWRILLFILLALGGTLFALFFAPIYSNRMSILYAGLVLILGMYLFTLSQGKNPVIIALLILLFLIPFGFRLCEDFRWANHVEGEYQLFVNQINTCPQDTCLVNPRAHEETLTRENWAKAVASYYGKDYLGLKSSFPAQVEAIWQTPSFTLEEANGIRISGLRYVNQDPYTRILYVMVAQNDLEPLQIDLKTIDLPDWAESLAWAMPREVLYRVLPTVFKHRALENRSYDEDTIYAFVMPVDNGRDDILALGIKDNGKILGKSFLRDIEFR